MTKLENRMGFRTRYKVVEEMGQLLCGALVRKDPHPKQCVRESASLAQMPQRIGWGS